MKKLSIFLPVILISSLTGCAALAPSSNNSPVEKPQTLYESRLFDAQKGSEISISELTQKLARTDVVVIGEYHGHQGSHLLQSRLQAGLYQQQPQQLLSMEQFNLDNQAAVDAYLNGSTGETEFIEDSHAWDNYRASYRPLVEFARQHNLPVLAANAPASIVRCVGRTGPGYLGTLPGNIRADLPPEPFMDAAGYRETFDKAMAGGHGAPDATMRKRLDNTYKAQLLRDNTMASRILAARKAHPEHQILHTTGTFHSENHLGTVALLRQRAPEISVAVISPVVWPSDKETVPLQENREKGDFLYIIQPLPDEFRDEDREHKAMAARFRHPTEQDTCQGESP